MAEINIKKMAQKAIQELKNNGVFVSRWIPVTECLPKELVDVLVYDGVDMFVAFLRSGEWFSCDLNFDTHTNILVWMPLPKPYESLESEE